MKHDHSTVFAFIQALSTDIKEDQTLPNIKHVTYFTDGCGGQYKNRN